MKLVVRSLIGIGALCSLGGCSRYRQWAVAQFEQTGERDTERATVDSYVQSLDQWDGFTTVGRFDAIWCAAPVVEWQVRQLAERSGGSCLPTAPLREQLLQELESFAIFYLLMTDDTDGSLRPQLSLDDAQNATWSVMLRVGDAITCPVSITKISRCDIDPSLIALFGPRYDARYRKLYRITFARAALQGHELLADMPCMQLILRSIAYECVITWTAEMVGHHRVYSEHIR